MRMTRLIAAAAVALSMASSSAFAQGAPPESAPQAPVPVSVTSPQGKALVYSGAAVFAGGMATALFAFIRADNGQFATFGEATSRNKQLGAAGIAAAFAGGTLIFLGNRASRYAPSVAVTPNGFVVGKAVSW